MNCPECGDKDAKSIPLARFYTYLCTNQSCKYYDFDHAVSICRSAIAEMTKAEDRLELPDGAGYYYPGHWFPDD